MVTISQPDHRAVRSQQTVKRNFYFFLFDYYFYPAAQSNPWHLSETWAKNEHTFLSFVEFFAASLLKTDRSAFYRENPCVCGSPDICIFSLDGWSVSWCVFTAHDRMADRPGNEATLRAFRAHKQRWRTASFPLMISVFLLCVCVCVRGCVCVPACTYFASLFQRREFFFLSRGIVGTLSAPDGGDGFA